MNSDRRFKTTSCTPPVRALTVANSVKDFRMLGQALGEGAAAFDGYRQFVNDALEGGVALLLFQHAQTAQQRQAGIHQRG